MYECGNGYLESWTYDQLRRLRSAARTEAQLRIAKSGHRATGWPKDAMDKLGGRLVAIGQRLQHYGSGYQVASQ